ncbi:MAG TPA: N-acetylmuramic acid 6-phosphate etherase [Streptosporangiaceae bacterium]|nr:N-acetylmuramic acid 6-phosphate etherase [Streptosporangiaceae bacterium]
MKEPLPRTEQRNPASSGLGELSAAAVIELMDTEEPDALRAVRQVTPLLAQAAERIAAVFSGGGRTVFIGSGTSGRIALQEAAELPPTFGVPPDSFLVMAAGGPLMGPTAITPTEDDEQAAPRALAELPVGPADAVVGLSASGTAPFVRAGVRAAARAGAWTCGIAHNPGAPLLAEAELGILLDTGPEVLTGSTRLKAGTAQKLALNRITTAAMVLAGRVADNYMIELTGSNAKLRARAIRIVMDLAALDEPEARRRLGTADWSVRAALSSWRESRRPSTECGE